MSPFGEGAMQRPELVLGQTCKQPLPHGGRRAAEEEGWNGGYGVTYSLY